MVYIGNFKIFYILVQFSEQSRETSSSLPTHMCGKALHCCMEIHNELVKGWFAVGALRRGLELWVGASLHKLIDCWWRRSNEAVRQGVEALNASLLQFSEALNVSLLNRHSFFTQHLKLHRHYFFKENNPWKVHHRYFLKEIHRLTLHHCYF
jgi:hypothetical protein